MTESEKHEHYWQPGNRGQKPSQFGRWCNRCYVYEPDFIACCATVSTSQGLATYSHRCPRKGKVQYKPVQRERYLGFDRWHPWEIANKGATMPESGWWYCGVHSPVRLKAAQAKRDAAYNAKNATRDAGWDVATLRRALAAEAERWYADELLVGEGFCDTTCEHHACKLARAVVAVHEAEGERERLKAAMG